MKRALELVETIFYLVIVLVVQETKNQSVPRGAPKCALNLKKLYKTSLAMVFFSVNTHNKIRIALVGFKNLDYNIKLFRYKF